MSRSKFHTILFCFFLSGAAGLTYQVAWTKALGLVFGHTVYAIATVLATFMGGLAAGSALLGRWGERHPRPVALYGWLEMLIASTGALSLLGLSAVRSVYLAAYHTVADSTPFLVALRFVASALVLFVPTFLMGGTLPILARGITRTAAELGSRLSRLYWVNTAGAVVGTLAAGFLLLPGLGLRLTVVLAVALNVLAGVLALALRDSPTEQPSVDSRVKPIGAATGVPRFLLVSFGVVGATAMAYEIAWTRLLATTLGSSTYAFTIMLATFLAGISLGSWLFEVWVSRGREISLATLATTQTLTGLAAVVFLVIFQWLPSILWALVSSTHKSFGGLVLAQFAICALAMLPAAIVFGFNFPVVTMLIAGRPGSTGLYSAAVGRACAANTLGAILGAVATGFWLLPLLGSFRLVALTASANLLLALLWQLVRVPRRRVELVGNAFLAMIVAIAGWFGALFDPSVANFSVLLYRGRYASALSIEEVSHLSDLLFAEDGLNASIAVVRSNDYLALRTNGKIDASTGDATTQLMLGHLGALFHRAPRKVLIIGFGSGMTASAVARYPEVQQIDCVEIEPAVLRASPYLEPLNRGVLGDPRLHIFFDDARNFLFTTRNQYDLIISEPSNPWIAGVATLFTDEFYSEVRSRLAPGGMLVQWVQAYSIFPEDVKTILATLAPHFSAVTAWRGNRWDMILLAQSDPGSLSLDRLRQFWAVPSLRADYQALRLSRPEGLIALHLLDDSDLRKMVAGAPHNTDDRMRLEYRAPLALFADRTSENMQMIFGQQSQLLPASVPIADARAALAAAADTLMAQGNFERAGVFLSALGKGQPTAEIALLSGNWLLAANRPEEARKAFEDARRLDPASLFALQGLAELARLHNDFGTAERLLREILARQPQFVPALESYALLERSREHWAQAIDWLTKRFRADPGRPPELVALLGELFVRSGDTQNAERAFISVLQSFPYNSDARRNLAEIYRSQKRWDEARIHLEVVVHYDPMRDPGTYLSLADVYRNLGRPRDAESILSKGRRLFPGETLLARAATGR